MAQAIDAFLAEPPPVVADALLPDVSFGGALLDAYEKAARTSTTP
jgi:hypothetical protein